MNYENKLSEIVDQDIARVNRFANMEEITLLEKELDIVLDDNYKEFLLKYCDCYIKDDYFYKPIEKNPMMSVKDHSNPGYFYGSNISQKIEMYKEEFAQDYIPISDLDGGDLICIGLTGELKGRLYFWSHDDEGENGQRFFLIANSFLEFINSFEYQKSEEINLNDVEITLDLDLM